MKSSRCVCLSVSLPLIEPANNLTDYKVKRYVSQNTAMNLLAKY